MWTKFTEVHIVLYETLVRDFDSELARLSRFLGISPARNQDRLRCLRENSEGSFHRSVSEKIEFPFSREDSEDLIRDICHVNKLVGEYDNNTQLPIEVYNEEIEEKFYGSLERPLPEIKCS